MNGFLQDYEVRDGFGPIPDKTNVVVSAQIKMPTDNISTKSRFAKTTGSGYELIDLEFTVVDGDYKGKKFWDSFFFFSPKDENGETMKQLNGKLRQILSSANNIDVTDDEAIAKLATDLPDVFKKPFAVSVKIEKSDDGKERNRLYYIIDNKNTQYGEAMSGNPTAKATNTAPASGWGA